MILFILYFVQITLFCIMGQRPWIMRNELIIVIVIIIIIAGIIYYTCSLVIDIQFTRYKNANNKRFKQIVRQNNFAKIYSELVLTGVCSAVYFRFCIDLMHILKGVEFYLLCKVNEILYHYVPTLRYIYNVFENIIGKGQNAGNHKVVQPSQNKFESFYHIYFFASKCFQFGTNLYFVVWQC